MSFNGLDNLKIICIMQILMAFGNVPRPVFKIICKCFYQLINKIPWHRASLIFDLSCPLPLACTTQTECFYEIRDINFPVLFLKKIIPSIANTMPNRSTRIIRITVVYRPIFNRWEYPMAAVIIRTDLKYFQLCKCVNKSELFYSLNTMKTFITEL